ncbi:MAG: type II toxin-antitoxin system RelE/ParE family toxin [Acidobacteriota bacterium]
MKKFEVIVTPQAQSDILSAFGYIHERSPLNATRWIQQLYREIDSLESLPERCGHAREQEYLDAPLRQLLFKSHRIIFSVERTIAAVYVLHVRHAKQRAVGERKEGESEI